MKTILEDLKKHSTDEKMKDMKWVESVGCNKWLILCPLFNYFQGGLCFHCLSVYSAYYALNQVCCHLFVGRSVKVSETRGETLLPVCGLFYKALSYWSNCLNDRNYSVQSVFWTRLNKKHFTTSIMSRATILIFCSLLIFFYINKLLWNESQVVSMNNEWRGWKGREREKTIWIQKRKII